MKVPTGWRLTRVGDACSVLNNLRKPLSQREREAIKGEYPYFGPTGILDYVNEYRIDGEFALIGEDGDHFLKYRDKPLTIFFSGKANVNNHAHVIGTSSQCYAKWFYYSFMYRDITSHLTRQGAKRYKLTKAALEKLPILIPPMDQQRRIIAILSAWDAGIAATDRLLANCRQQKKALMQQLLTGEARPPGFDKPWQAVRFHDLFDRVRRKNTSGCERVLTISGQHGLVDQVDFFNKSVASDNLSTYTLLRRGEFAYNRSYSAGYPMGAIKPLELYDEGVVSSLYICFALNPGAGYVGFFRHFFESGVFNREIYAVAQEGARNHGLLNVGMDDFFNTNLRVPDLDEQLAIARMIDAAEAEVACHRARLQSLQKEKQALMQQLLTGKRRVKVDQDQPDVMPA